MQLTHRLVLVSLLVLVVSIQSADAAPAGVLPTPEPRVTVSFQDRSLSRALQELFASAPVGYRLLASSATPLFHLDVKDAPLSEALSALLAQDGGAEPLVFALQTGPGGGQVIIQRETIYVEAVGGSVRLNLVNARLPAVLQRVLTASDLEHRGAETVPPVLVTQTVRARNWREALSMLLINGQRQVPGLTYSRSEGVLVIHVQRHLDTTARRLDLNLRQTELRKAIEELFAGSEWRCVVDDAVPQAVITVSATQETEGAVLRAMLAAARGSGGATTYREEAGVVYIEPGPLPGESEGDALASPRTARVSLLCEGRRLREVLRSLAGSSGARIDLAPDVPDLPVYVSVADMPLERAVEAVVARLRTSLPGLMAVSGDRGIEVRLRR
jgi:hypothetical protein